MTRIVPADEWRLLEWQPLTPLTLPVDELWVHHGAKGTGKLGTLRSYERFHLQTRGWRAPGYGWAITDDGTIYELRGASVGAHTRGRNDISVAVLLVGDWSTKTPPPAVAKSLAWLTQHLYETGVLSAPAINGGHGDAPGQSTACPGRGGRRTIGAARKILQTMSNAETEEPDLLPDERKLLIDTAEAVARLERRIGQRNEDRSTVMDDLRRVRITGREIAAEMGMETELEASGDPVPS